MNPALEMAAPPTSRFRPAPVVVAVGSALAAVLYVAMRAATARSLTGVFAFEGYCERVDPPDAYPCHTPFTGPARAYLVGVLIVWITLAGIPFVLALAGRGVWSLTPLVALVTVQLGGWILPDAVTIVPWLGVEASPFWTSEIGAGYWSEHLTRAVVADVVLLALPTVLVLALTRPARRVFEWHERRSFLFASALCLTGGGAVVWVADDITWGSLGYSVGIPMWVPAAVIATFGALVPRGRWYPWSVLLAAVLLSAGIPGLIVSTTVGFPTTLWFASALPLAVIGLLASAVGPLAAWLERRRSGTARVRPASSVSTRELRPAVVVNTIAVGLVLVSIMAASADPLPTQLSTPLPTYLGIRDRAQDARAVMNVIQALDAASAHRVDGGARFDAAAGAIYEPTLRWREGPSDRDLTIAVLRGTPTLVRVGSISASGAAVCAQATASDEWAPTYGVGASQGTQGTRRALAEAVANCGERPLTADAVPDLPVGTMCDAVDRDSLVICRSVQHLVREILDAPRGR